MISIKQESNHLLIDNGIVRVTFDLERGVCCAEDCASHQLVIEEAYAQVNELKSCEDGMQYTWSTEDIEDALGRGKMARITCRDRCENEIILGFILYEQEGFLALRCGFHNGGIDPIQVKVMKPLAGGRAFSSFDIEDAKLLDGNSGAFVTEVLHGGALKSRNNGLLMFGKEFHTSSLVMGGLTYEDFAKYAVIEMKEENGCRYARLELYAEDPYGRRVDGGSSYFPERDTYYVDFTVNNPFQALEKYGRCLKKAQGAEPNRYQFPSVCLWYAEFYDMLNSNSEKFNTSAGAVKQMEIIKDTGFLKYAPVAVRLVPDYYGEKHLGGDLQQGWWDDEHWRKYQDPDEGNGTYVEPYETTEKWTKAVEALGGIPLTYFQTSVMSEDYAREYPGHTLFNRGKCTKGIWLNDSYSPDTGYDFTDEDFIRHMQEVYRNLKQGGIRGMMFDYPGTGWKTEGGFENPYATTANNYINVFRLAKEGLGKDSYIHERGIETGYDVTLGWVDSQRTEDDTADMPPEMVKKIGLRWYKNRVVTNYDMDSKDLMRAQSADELHTLVTMAYAVSGRLLLANGFENLDEDTRYALSRTYPQHVERKSFRPADAFLGKEYPQVYDYEIDEKWHQVILYNGDRLHDQVFEAGLSADTAFGGLGLDPSGEYYVYDFWNDQYIGRLNGTDSLRQRVRRGESRILSVRKVSACPQVISTNRHIMQGLVDLEKVEWQEDCGCLSGVSHLIADEAYQIKIKLPDTELYEEPEVPVFSGNTSYTAEYNPFENMVTLTLLPMENTVEAWKISLRRRNASERTTPESPKNVSADWCEEALSLMLKWDELEDCEYCIYANTDDACKTAPLYLIGKTRKPWFEDTSVRSQTSRFYLITARNRDGMVSEPAACSFKADYENPVKYWKLDCSAKTDGTGLYGSQGYSLRGEGAVEMLPSFIQEIRSNGNRRKSEEKDSEFCLNLPEGGKRHLGYESNTGVLSYAVIANDREEHQAAFYCVDSLFDRFGSIAGSRKMSMELKTLSGRVMKEDVTVEQFREGVYIVVKFRESFTVTLRNMIHIGMFDAVCSGIFFD